jgi:hypothetical protein
MRRKRGVTKGRDLGTEVRSFKGKGNTVKLFTWYMAERDGYSLSEARLLKPYLSRDGYPFGKLLILPCPLVIF